MNILKIFVDWLTRMTPIPGRIRKLQPHAWTSLNLRRLFKAYVVGAIRRPSVPEANINALVTSTTPDEQRTPFDSFHSAPEKKKRKTTVARHKATLSRSALSALPKEPFSVSLDDWIGKWRPTFFCSDYKQGSACPKWRAETTHALALRIIDESERNAR